MNEILNFIDQNRQTGSTTQLIKNIENGGYLVVVNNRYYDRWVGEYPHLKSNIFTLDQVAKGRCRGLPRAKLFFDTNTMIAYFLQKDDFTNKLSHQKDDLINELNGIVFKLNSMYSEV